MKTTILPSLITVKIKYFIGVFIWLFINSSYSQEQKKVDSLLKAFSLHQKDTIGAKALYNLALQYENKNDSLLQYYAVRSLELSKKIEYQDGVACAYNSLGIVKYDLGEVDSAIYFYTKSIEIYSKIKNIDRLIIANLNLGTAYRQSGKLAEAINCYFTGLRNAEKLNDTKQIAQANMLLGNVYRQKKDFTLAKKFYEESLELSLIVKNPTQVATIYNNIGLLHCDFKDHRAALNYFVRSLGIRDSLNLKRKTAISLENIACEYSDMEMLDSSYYYHDKALKIFEVFDDKKGMGNVLINMASIKTKQKKYANAIDNLLTALELIKQVNHKDMLKDIYVALSQNYEALKNFESALFYHKIYLSQKDSIFNDTESEKIIEMNTKYETEKKETQNKLLSTENILSAKTIKQQKLVSYFIIGGLIILTLFAVFIFRSLKQQRKANSIIQEQKKIVEHQKHLVEEHQKEILDSIHYAKRIQNTLLAHKDFVDEHIKENFIFFKPKDIVSGDFYWAAKHGNNFYIAACDSTGHGVPGAFMSLLNINFLNEAINEKDILEPNKILNFVRERLIKSISKDGQKDGFDGILLRINEDTKELTYAAANNAPMIISDGAYVELESDRMPVGQGERKEEFKLFSINAKAGATLYLYTDGYADQFGGPKGKKFKYKPLNELILSISNLPFDQQSVILNEKFENWRGELEQVDDVCIIGIKL